MTEQRRALRHLVVWPAVALLLAALAINGWALVRHAWTMLRYPYPVDYGEGPLLAQIAALAHGVSLAGLYGDPAAPPYLVVNYPPVYLLAAWLAGALVGDLLIGGRLVSLLATLALVPALALLARPGGRGIWLSTLLCLTAVGLPIVREWGVLLRVDLLGIALGLWALVALRIALERDPQAGWRAMLPVALGFVASGFVKPTLLAAPAAALLWLAWRRPAGALRLGVLTAGIGGVALGGAIVGTGGAFWLHVVTANANDWELALARGFWGEQHAIHGALWWAALLCAAAVLSRYTGPATRERLLLPLYYTLFASISAFGVGKVGAYANYFLELLLGMVWLVAATAGAAVAAPQNLTRRTLAGVLTALCAASLAWHVPLWSAQALKPYGLVEGQRTPRPVWDAAGGLRADLQREQQILAALGRINAVLVPEVRRAGGAILSDIPGIAAQAGVPSRLQVFEHRQLLDGSRYDQRPLLRDLANGAVPLIMLDYLGNWLTPEVQAVIVHRYAQDGSRGAYDRYLPLAPGSWRPHAGALGAAIEVRAVALAGTSAQPGELLLLGVRLAAAGASPCDGTACALVAELRDGAGTSVAQQATPLLYGALAPRDWGADGVQQLVTLAIGPHTAPGRYTLALRLTPDGTAHDIATITVADGGGRLLGEQGYFVAEPMLRAWQAAGGYAGLGDPLTPLVPFADHQLQCFVRGCLSLRDGAVGREPLGQLVMLAEAAPQAATIDPQLAEAYQALGGAPGLGPVLGPAFVRGDRLVQYARDARIEQPLAGGPARLGALGIEYLRLEPGARYRWPAP
jgi:hypothetical protein